MNKFWKTLFSTLNVKISLLTVYHAQKDGLTKIAHRNREEIIRCFVNYEKDDWNEHLVKFEVAYNASVYSTTPHIPFFLNYGVQSGTIPAERIIL